MLVPAGWSWAGLPYQVPFTRLRLCWRFVFDDCSFAATHSVQCELHESLELRELANHAIASVQPCVCTRIATIQASPCNAPGKHDIHQQSNCTPTVQRKCETQNQQWNNHRPEDNRSHLAHTIALASGSNAMHGHSLRIGISAAHHTPPPLIEAGDTGIVNGHLMIKPHNQPACLPKSQTEFGLFACDDAGVVQPGVLNGC